MGDCSPINTQMELGVNNETGFNSFKGQKLTETFEHDRVVQPLLTDLYQITMAYAYWKSERGTSNAVFDLYFRKNPFRGEFTIFAGLQDVLEFLEHFRYSHTDIAYLRKALPSNVDGKFFEYLKTVSAKDITIHAVKEGSVVFPGVPLMRVEGPLIIAQLLETTLLTLVSYASLVATNASRYRIAAGESIKLFEFGLRRAQGPDGGLSASRYSYVGGFDGTSNVLAGKLYRIPVSGTHAHSYISSFSNLDELSCRTIKDKSGNDIEFVQLCILWRDKLTPILDVLEEEAIDGELAAFIAYGMAFPNNFMVLVDTYDTRRSGLLNFCAVAMSLADVGYLPKGIRIDSGDLAFISNLARQKFTAISERYDKPWFKELTIIASNDINEETIWSLNNQGHSINCFGVGTNLVTCQNQPALGCVFKLVEVDKVPKLKISEDIGKTTMPGKKEAYRLYGQDGYAVLDLMLKSTEAAPIPAVKFLCRHPFLESKRAWVKPSKLEKLHQEVWSNGQRIQPVTDLKSIRQHVNDSMKTIRPSHFRHRNPQQYKVAVSECLYQFIHKLWLERSPIGKLC